MAYLTKASSFFFSFFSPKTDTALVPSTVCFRSDLARLLCVFFSFLFNFPIHCNLGVAYVGGTFTCD